MGIDPTSSAGGPQPNQMQITPALQSDLMQVENSLLDILHESGKGNPISPHLYDEGISAAKNVMHALQNPHTQTAKDILSITQIIFVILEIGKEEKQAPAQLLQSSSNTLKSIIMGNTDTTHSKLLKALADLPASTKQNLYQTINQLQHLAHESFPSPKNIHAAANQVQNLSSQLSNYFTANPNSPLMSQGLDIENSLNTLAEHLNTKAEDISIERHSFMTIVKQLENIVTGKTNNNNNN